jgi:tetratricopeptide (TPR) repeat protein
MEAQFRQALALQKAGRLDEAEAIYRRIVAWKPEWVLGNLGVILRVTGRLEEAETVLRAALAADPASAAVRHTLGMTLLQRGRYAEGWRHYAARFDFIPNRAPPQGLAEWRGESLAGKRLLVIAEQGLGDQVLLSRFVGMTGAEEVALAIARPLVRLLSALPAEVSNPQDWEGVKADCWTRLGLIPRWLELGPADAPAPYLPCPPRPLSGVGLMLEGAPKNANNALRLPGPAVARAIRGLAPFVDLSPEASGAGDFADTAEIVAGLKEVVTVDTSVAHLAGAMGKPTWVMMPARAIDWWANWHDDRTPWYPSVRLIRQRRAGDWAGVIADLARVLERP